RSRLRLRGSQRPARAAPGVRSDRDRAPRAPRAGRVHGRGRRGALSLATREPDCVLQPRGGVPGEAARGRPMTLRRAAAVALAVIGPSLAAPALARGDKPVEPVPDLLRRQTQELFDAISSGSPAVWEKYLDPDVRFGDESGTVAGKK